MCPSPPVPPRNSPSTSPVKPSAAPRWMPDRLYGSVAGTMIFQPRAMPFTPYTRPAFTREVLTVTAPSIVFRMIGNTASRNTSAIFDSLPSPRPRMNSGASATFGVEYSSQRNGATVNRSTGDQPTARPTVTPTATAMTRPIATLPRL